VRLGFYESAWSKSGLVRTEATAENAFFMIFGAAPHAFMQNYFGFVKVSPD
jgi:hypothetical protein